MKNWKVYGRKWSWLNQGPVPTFVWRDRGETIQNLSQDIWCPDQDLIQVPPEYKSRTFSLEQSIWCTRYHLLFACGEIN
jgi:hypothetical protein